MNNPSLDSFNLKKPKLSTFTIPSNLKKSYTGHLYSQTSRNPKLAIFTIPSPLKQLS